MPAERKASVRELSSAAYELGFDVIQGCVHRGAGGGRWTIDGDNLDRWMAEHDGEEVVLILASLEDDRPMPTKTCRTCGTEYTGAACPRCRAARVRLRGR